MIKVGLDDSDAKLIIKDLRDSHSIRCTIDILNKNEEHIERLEPLLLSGSVQYDASAEVTRTLQATFLDPYHKLAFDANNPAKGAMFADRFLRVDYGIYGPNLQRWVDVPVFTGPIDTFHRTGAVVDISCLGKESLLQEMLWDNMVLFHGESKVNALKRIAKVYGETRFDFPQLTSKLPHKIQLHKQTIGWKVMSKIARSMNRQLFYDGRGILRLRRTPDHKEFAFEDGENGNILTDPDITFDKSEVRNAIRVKAKRKGSGKHITYTAYPDPSHPLSPQSLSRNGALRYLPEMIELDHAATKAEVMDLAKKRLEYAIEMAMDTTFETLPNPFLEELDKVEINSSGYSINARMKQWTISLGTESMSMGYNKRIKPRRHAIR